MALLCSDLIKSGQVRGSLLFWRGKTGYRLAFAFLSAVPETMRVPEAFYFQGNYNRVDRLNKSSCVGSSLPRLSRMVARVPWLHF